MRCFPPFPAVEHLLCPLLLLAVGIVCSTTFKLLKKRCLTQGSLYSTETAFAFAMEVIQLLIAFSTLIDGSLSMQVMTRTESRLGLAHSATARSAGLELFGTAAISAGTVFLVDRVDVAINPDARDRDANGRPVMIVQAMLARIRSSTFPRCAPVSTEIKKVLVREPAPFPPTSPGRTCTVDNSNARSAASSGMTASASESSLNDRNAHPQPCAPSPPAPSTPPTAVTFDTTPDRLPKSESGSPTDQVKSLSDKIIEKDTKFGRYRAMTSSRKDLEKANTAKNEIMGRRQYVRERVRSLEEGIPVEWSM